jgi:CBS-domain-containing membrane protein
MNASDVMVCNVITIGPKALVSEAAKLLSENDISAVPVIDQQGNVVGILSEADLIRREEIGTEKKHYSWLEAAERPKLFGIAPAMSRVAWSRAALDGSVPAPAMTQTIKRRSCADKDRSAKQRLVYWLPASP